LSRVSRRRTEVPEGGDAQGRPGVGCMTQHWRRPYGEGQLEPDMEHQDEKEKPGEKRQEQEPEEEIGQCPRLPGRRCTPATTRQCGPAQRLEIQSELFPHRNTCTSKNMKTACRPHIRRPEWHSLTQSLHRKELTRWVSTAVPGKPDRFPCLHSADRGRPRRG